MKCAACLIALALLGCGRVEEEPSVGNPSVVEPPQEGGSPSVQEQPARRLNSRDFQSCEGLGEVCAGEDCCTTLWVPGGTFIMGDDDDNSGFHKPAHEVSLDGFYLDKFRVVAARFEKFLKAFDGSPPAVGSGMYPPVPDSGWRQKDSDDLLSVFAKPDVWLAYFQDPGGEGANFEVGTFWPMAQAFCIWDGGRLPTEAEFEYAGAGGEERRLQTWGDVPLHRNLNECEFLVEVGVLEEGICDGLCDYVDTFFCGKERFPVGAFPLGNARWGHADMMGLGGEWTMDIFVSEYKASAQENPLQLPFKEYEERVVRGAITNRKWSSREAVPTTVEFDQLSIGFRCARDKRVGN